MQAYMAKDLTARYLDEQLEEVYTSIGQRAEKGYHTLKIERSKLSNNQVRRLIASGYDVTSNFTLYFIDWSE
jgi:hypothetical protein